MLPTLFVAGACASPDSPVGLRSTTGVAAIKGSDEIPGCVGNATTTVTTEAALHAALATAVPGDVIAVSGTIHMFGAATIAVPNVTLTCTSLATDKLVGHSILLVGVVAPHVTVQGLLLDVSSQSGATALESVNLPPTSAATHTRVIGNRFSCGGGGGACVFFIGSTDGYIADNYLEASGAASGFHMQGSGGRVDRMLVERNVLVALSNSGGNGFGAMRPRDGHSVVIRDNQIFGPWSNGVASTQIDSSVYERNEIRDVRLNGFLIGSAAAPPTQVQGLLVRHNEVSTSLGNGATVNFACGNVFLANRFVTAAPNFDMIFSPTSGDNVVLGPGGTIVENGSRDCDGDGLVDRNSVPGARRGTHPGSVIGPVMRTAGGIVIE